MRGPSMPRLCCSTTMQLSDLARAHLASRHVVCDRYLVSPVALLTSDPYVTTQEVATIVATYEPYYCSHDLTLLLTVACAVTPCRSSSSSWKSRQSCASLSVSASCVMPVSTTLPSGARSRSSCSTGTASDGNSVFSSPS